MLETSFFKRPWHPPQRLILLIYFVGILIASIYVPWHATSGYISEGTGAIIQEDYLGYDFLWSRPVYGRWLVEIDLSAVLLEMIALTAVASIAFLSPTIWELFESRV
jgi:hypothetical protein